MFVPEDEKPKNAFQSVANNGSLFFSFKFISLVSVVTSSSIYESSYTETFFADSFSDVIVKNKIGIEFTHDEKLSRASLSLSPNRGNLNPAIWLN